MKRKIKNFCKKEPSIHYFFIICMEPHYSILIQPTYASKKDIFSTCKLQPNSLHFSKKKPISILLLQLATDHSQFFQPFTKLHQSLNCILTQPFHWNSPPFCFFFEVILFFSWENLKNSLSYFVRLSKSSIFPSIFVKNLKFIINRDFTMSTQISKPYSFTTLRQIKSIKRCWTFDFSKTLASTLVLTVWQHGFSQLI